MGRAFYACQIRDNRLRNDDVGYPGAWQTSTHSAAVNSAIRCGAMRTALWGEPAAGTTISNALSETSQ